MSEIWIRLADYYFLDTEPAEYELKALAQFLSDQQLQQSEVYRIMLEEVAPVAGKNLGYLIYPVTGNWEGFDKSDLAEKINSYKQKRSRGYKWIYSLQDIHTKWMLKKIQLNDLLNLLKQ